MGTLTRRLGEVGGFLRQDQELHCKHFDDVEWIQHISVDSVTGTGPLDDVPEDAVTSDPPEFQAASPKAKLIKMGEFLRKYVSRRLRALSDKGIVKLMIAVRQLGNGSSGGAEALAFPIS